MAKSVEKYLNKIAKLIEESSASVGENLIKRIEDMLKQDDYVPDKLINARPIALAVFHELFSRYNHHRVTSKTGRNEFLSDWIDVSQVFHSEAAMLKRSCVHKGDEIFRTDLNKTFVNITAKNESMDDWQEVFYDKASPILDPNREHLYCNLNGTSEYVNLPSETELFTPETYYDVIGNTSHMLYIHSIYGDTAYGYMLSWDEDGYGSQSQINYEKIAFRNSNDIRSQYNKCRGHSEYILNFVKSLPKNFPSDTNAAEVSNQNVLSSLDKAASPPKHQLSITELVKQLINQPVVFRLDKLIIQIKLSSFDGDVTEELLSLKVQGLIKSSKCIHSDIYELVIRDKHN